MKILSTMTAILGFFGWDAKNENVLTEEHVTKINNELGRLQGENTNLAGELATAKTSIETLTGDKTKLEGEKTQLTSDLKDANEKVTAHEKTIKEHVDTIASLKRTSGEDPAGVGKKSDGNIENNVLDFVSKNMDNTAACMEELKKAGF